MAPAPPPLLAIDLDGTLVDTAPDLMAALNATLVHDGLSPLPLNAVKAMVGAGARILVERGFVASGVRKTQGEIDAAFEVFTEHYRAHIADDSRPFPGVIEALDRLAAAGWRFAVCTNKLEDFSRLLLDQLGLTRRFAAVVGGDTVPGVKKPDPRILLHCIAAAGGSPRRAVMLGDSAADIEAARAAGVPVVAVDFGYTAIPVSELRPDRIISHFDQLDAALDGLVDLTARGTAAR